MFRENRSNVFLTFDNHDTVEEYRNQLKINETFEQEINGLHLIMNYHAPTSSFIGVVENTTSTDISGAKVEIYLSNAVELGPTRAVDLTPGEMKNIALLAYGQEFKEWNVIVEFQYSSK